MRKTNRQILREQAREETKMQKWFNNFTPQQARFHKELVRKIVQDTQDKTEMILDSCYIGAMLGHTELELSECIKIAKLANVNMEETSKHLREEREYYTMINDENLREIIREEAKKLQREGIKIAPGIKELRKLYNFPQKDIHIIWAEGREEIKAELKADKEVEKDFPYAVTEKEIEDDRSIPVKGPIEELGLFKASSKLKILEQTIKGQYGTYIKSSEGVKTEKISVKDTKDLEEYKKAVEDEYNKGTDELNKRFNDLQEEMRNFDKRANKNFAIIKEIAAVFNM